MSYSLDGNLTGKKDFVMKNLVLGKLRFSLRTLLLLVTIACVAIFWYTRHRQAVIAKQEYLSVMGQL